MAATVFGSLPPLARYSSVSRHAISLTLDRNWSDFHDGSVGIPAFVREGQNVHIKATVDKYNPDNGIFKLDLVEMTER